MKSYWHSSGRNTSCQINVFFFNRVIGLLEQEEMMDVTCPQCSQTFSVWHDVVICKLEKLWSNTSVPKRVPLRMQKSLFLIIFNTSVSTQSKASGIFRLPLWYDLPESGTWQWEAKREGEGAHHWGLPLPVIFSISMWLLLFPIPVTSLREPRSLLKSHAPWCWSSVSGALLHSL